MLIALEDGSVLRADFVVSAVQRFDLVPVPSTLELTLRADASIGDRVKDGSVLLAGSSQDRYRIVKFERAVSTVVQGPDDPAQVFEITAVLDSLHALVLPLSRAVVKESRSLGEVYRSCGATARITDDIPTGRFACFVGQFPTVGIAQVLQEEGAAALWRASKALAFVRLADLFGGKPVETFAQDMSRAVQSGFQERHEVPFGISNAPDGSVIAGRRDPARGHFFVPRTPARVLDNMTRCLVVRRTLDVTFAGNLRAGDLIEIAGSKHLVTTARHAWGPGGAGSSPEQSTRLWLAQLSR